MNFDDWFKEEGQYLNEEIRQEWSPEEFWAKKGWNAAQQSNIKVFCKAIKCQWNIFDKSKGKHRCNKDIIHIENNGWCPLSKFARPIANNQSM